MVHVCHQIKLKYTYFLNIIYFCYGRFGKVFEPEKWDVIIRVLAPPKRQYDQQQRANGGNKYRRKAEWDTRSRRSSLPTLYEYDSDGGSSVRTLTTDGGRGKTCSLFIICS